MIVAMVAAVAWIGVTLFVVALALGTATAAILEEDTDDEQS